MMYFLTIHDLYELRERGYEESHLHACPSPSRVDRASRLIGEVAEVFKDVVLGTGVGLFEGQEIDNYGTAEQRDLKRSGDEKVDWRRIESKHLNACHSSLSFFDAAGMRFQLPAFLCCDLRGEFQDDLGLYLSILGDRNKGRFSLLEPQEMAVVATYLEFLSEDIAAEYSRERIQKALDGFWRT